MSDDPKAAEHFDIVIVGAGLVGATFASLLIQEQARRRSEGKTALSIALIDGGKAPSPPDTSSAVFDPRVVALTSASKNLMVHLGVWEQVVAGRACAYRRMYVWDHEGTANIAFDAQELAQKELGHIVENNLLLCTLLDELSDREGLSILRSTRVEALDIADDSKNPKQPSLIHCVDGRVFSADLVVAADGAQSKIRDLAGLPIRQWEYEHKAIVATVKSSKPHEFTAWQNFLATGPLAFLPLEHPSDQYCSIVWSAETERADELMALDDQAFSLELARAFEYQLGEVESVSQRFCFPLKQRHAIDYSRSNIVLMGDAAHTIHPLAGQGVNLGLLDAKALGNEIVRAQSRGLAISDASILKRYQRQRKAHNLELMVLMEGFKRLFGSRDLAVRWLRNWGMNKVNQWNFLKNWLAKQAIKNDE